MRRASCAILNGLVLSLSLFACPDAAAQGYDPNKSTGTPSTIYDISSVDSVDLASGNLRISIPLLSLPGRGLNTDIALTYNSKIWKTQTESDPYIGNWYQVLVDAETNWTPSHGWGMGIPRMGRTGNSESICLYYGPYGCDLYSYYYNWVTNDGTRFSMVDDNGPVPYGGQVTGYWSFDGTYARYDWTTFWMRYKDGVAARTLWWPNPTTQSESTLRDTNGNYIRCTTTVTTSPPPVTIQSQQCTDTLGRVVSFAYASNRVQTMTYKDSSGTTRTITFTYQNYTLSYPYADQAPGGSCDYGIVPECGYSGSMSAWLLTKVTLPNNRSYEFEYFIHPNGATTGEITKLILPTGGYIRYTYGWSVAEINQCWPGPPPVEQWKAHRRVVASRSVSEDGTPGAEKTWNYVHRECGTVGDTFVSRVTNPLGNIQAVTNQHGIPLPTKIEYKNSSGTPLRTILQSSGYSESGYNDPNLFGLFGSNPRILSSTTVLNDTNQQSKVELAYGTHGNVSSKTEYDWGSGAPGAAARTTSLTYLQSVNSNYALKTVHILDRVANQSTCDMGGVFCSTTAMEYDTALPTATSNVVQHDYTSHPSSYNYRGNPTRVKRWLNTTQSWRITTNVFNDVGNLLSMTDPGNHTATFSYAHNFHNYTPPQPTSAYVTSVTRPTTNGVAHVTRTQYYFDSGLPSASCGENFPAAATCNFGLAAPQPDYSAFSYDSMNRPAAAFQGDGGQTTLAYNEAALPISIASTTKIDPTKNLVTTAVYDGLGRTRQTQLNSNPGCVVKVDTTFDAIGRKETVSNPYCTTGDPTYGITKFKYDALSRTTRVIPPDGNEASDTNVVQTTYSGNTVTVTDQAGKKIKSETDALGRLIRVWEPDLNQNLVHVTRHQYDALDNLRCVHQKSTDATADKTCDDPTVPATWRPRRFTYSSLSQLLTANNPESGIISYTYDNDGNLVTKTDARGISVTHGYDELHRLATKNYSDTTPNPDVTYFYDQTSYNGLTISNGKGRRTGMSDAAGMEAWTFDVMGRALTDRRTTSGVTKDFSYQYNLDGSVWKITYPTNRTIEYQPTGAGRTEWAKDVANGINYAVSASYAAHGALLSVIQGQATGFGGYTLSQTYNNRLQPVTIVGVSPSTILLDFTYCFNKNIDLPTGNCAATPIINNGNVAQIKNNRNVNRTQNFTYDELNRILTAQSQAASGGDCWGLQYGFDVWANLLSASITKCSETMLSLSVDTKNRITNTGFSYDLSGSTLSDGSFNYAWDAESRMKSGAGVDYRYDGDGRRVKKDQIAGSTFDRLYWYGLGSDPLAESDLTGNITEEFVFFGGKRIARRVVSTNTIFYYFGDHLGSSRSIVQAGQTTACYEADFLPYGKERVVTNTCPQNYKFTGKERDTESGLDFFGARYFASTLGRFVSPDPLLNSGQPWNPQSWNRYAYVENNPLRYTDPLGLFKWAKNCDEGADAACKAERDRFRKSLENAKKAAEGLEKGSKERKQLEKALKRIGEEGKGSVRIAFGDAGTTDGRPNLGLTVGNKITLNLNAVDQLSKDYQLNESEAAALDAGLVAHEGEHAGAGPFVVSFLTMSRERTALFTESYTYQGLRNTDKVSRLWDESWAKVDRTLREVQRQEAIDRELRRQKGKEEKEQ
jgi:RHS repeat-associated protein